MAGNTISFSLDKVPYLELMEGRITTLENKKGQLEVRITDLEGKNGVLEKDFKTLKVEFDKLFKIVNSQTQNQRHQPEPDSDTSFELASNDGIANGDHFNGDDDDQNLKKQSPKKALCPKKKVEELKITMPPGHKKSTEAHFVRKLRFVIANDAIKEKEKDRVLRSTSPSKSQTKSKDKAKAPGISEVIMTDLQNLKETFENQNKFEEASTSTSSSPRTRKGSKISPQNELAKSKSPSSNPPANVDVEKRESCSFPYCTKTFKNSSSLSTHMRIHLNNLRNSTKMPKNASSSKKDPARSKIYKKASRTTKKKYVKKIKKESGLNFCCSVCDKEFKQKVQLINHHRVHTGEQPFDCGICGRMFSRVDSLNRHKLIHTGEKKYSCTLCPRKFSHSNTLVLHNLIHTGEKPHKCNVCQKKFRQRNNLIEHKLIHSGETPLQCSCCPRKFRHKRSLLRHEKTMH